MSDITGLITASRLHALCPKINGAILEAILTDAPAGFPKAGIDDEVKVAHFFAQIMTETGGLARLDENLAYTTTARLAKVFGEKLFSSEAAARPFLNNPEALANYVYANKNGNGDEASGDGWSFRGSGLIQLTGRGNFRAVDDKLGTHLEADPNLARQPDSALAFALTYWTENRISAVAGGSTDNDVRAVTAKINRKLVGLEDRKANFKKALRIFLPSTATARALAAASASPAVAASVMVADAGGAAILAAPELSGPAWASRFPTSQSLADLIEPFRDDAEAFVGALNAGGAQVAITATYRPKERAYLMHWAWRIGFEGFEPAIVPPMLGVAIIWAHPTIAKSRSAAKLMAQAFGMVHVAALNSRHTERRAVDMTISWRDSLVIEQHGGGRRTITSQPRNGSNRELIEVGAGYGCIKLTSDPPHWSDDGR